MPSQPASAVIVRRYCSALAVAIMSTGLPSRRLGRQEGASSAWSSSGSWRDLEPDRIAGVGAHDPRPARVGDDPDPAPRRQRLGREQRGDVEQLREGLGADHPALLEEGVDGAVGGRQQRAGVGAGGARARPPSGRS